MAATYYVCRFGFAENTPRPVLLTLGLSWFLLNCPYIVKQLWAGARASSSWMASDGAMALAGLVFVVCLGWLVGRPAGVPVAACGAISFAWRVLEWLRARGVRNSLEPLFWGSAFGICLTCWAWGDDLHDPLFRWALLTKEHWNGKVDELIHACWSNMIRTYGVPSSGLDGVPFYHYHFGSHIIFASFGELLEVSGIDVYQMIYPVVFHPLLLQSNVIAGNSFTSYSIGRQASPRTALLWPVALIGFAGVLPYSCAKSAGYYIMSDFASESMCVALTVMLLGLAAAAPLFRHSAEGGLTTARHSDSVIGMLGFPTLLFILGLLKFSVMAVCLAASTLLFLTVDRYRKSWLYGISLAAGFGALLVVSCVVLEPLRQREASSFFPLAYMRVWADISWWSYYIPLEVAITFIAISTRIWHENITTVSELIPACRGGKLADAAFAFFAACFSIAPGLIYDIQGGSAAYFTHVQRWISLPILLGVLLSLPSQRGESLSPRDQVLSLPLWKVGVWLFLLPVVGTIALNTARNGLRFVQVNLTDRGFGVSTDSGIALPGTRSSVKHAFRQGRFAHTLAMIREKTQEQQHRSDAEAETIRLLSDLFWLPREEKRLSLLYIPRSNRAFWDLLDQSKPRWLAPLVGPALSGIALIDGLPDPQDIPANGLNGYSSYEHARSPRPPSDRTKSALCRRAEQMGFRRIIVLDVNIDEGPYLEEWCFGGSRPLL
jgi:hypothetical protein